MDKAGEGTGDRAGDGGRGDFKAPAALGPAGYGTGMAPGLRAPPRLPGPRKLTESGAHEWGALQSCRFQSRQAGRETRKERPGALFSLRHMKLTGARQ